MLKIGEAVRLRKPILAIVCTMTALSLAACSGDAICWFAPCTPINSQAMVTNEGGKLIYRDVCGAAVVEARFYDYETDEEVAYFESRVGVPQFELDEAVSTVSGVKIPVDKVISVETVLEGGSSDVQDDRVAFVPAEILPGQAVDGYENTGSIEEIERSVRDLMCPS